MGNTKFSHGRASERDIPSLWSALRALPTRGEPRVVGIQPAFHSVGSVGGWVVDPNWFTNINETFIYRKRSKDRLFSYL